MSARTCYFVTGATGFIGRHLVGELARRNARIYLLVRAGSAAKLEALRPGWDGADIVPVEGELRGALLGVSAADRAAMRGNIAHFFHLAALYDLGAGAAELESANVTGTAHAIALAADLGAGCFHLASSIAAAGLYPGTFTEEMFEQAVGLEHPYFRTKHESERLVRANTTVPWRIYRPGMVVGHSQSGVMDKVDGPYYLFRTIQKIRHHVPAWVPLLGFEGGEVNLVPVDYVAAAMAHLAHLSGADGRCFHLTDPTPRHLGAVLNIFARAAHAPTMTLRFDSSLFSAVPGMLRGALASLRPAHRVVEEVMRELGVPRSIVQLIDYPTRFDSSRTRALLEGSGIAVPPLEDYAWRLWDYWERRLDPELSIDRSLAGAVRGKVVLLTGGSSGIGLATARRLAEAGAILVIVARDPQRLEAARASIAAAGGAVHARACDLADGAACEALARSVLGEFGHVDVLINNAGKSIRRAIENSYERFHDYERLMRVNYFGPVRLMLALLPSMAARRAGHVINVSSIGVLSNSPRFSAYIASKAALEAFSRCAAAEFGERGVRFTIVNMPLVRTPMSAPTRLYEQMPLIEAAQAAEMLCEAVIHQPKRLATRLGIFAQLMNLFAPKLSEIVMSQAYRMFPESEASGAAGAATGAPVRPSEEMIAFANIMRGIHW